MSFEQMKGKFVKVSKRNASEYQTVVTPRVEDKHQLSQEKKFRTRTIASIIVAIWFAATVVLGQAGVFEAGNRPPLGLLLSLVVPVAAFLGLYVGSKGFAKTVGSWSLRFLTLAQTTRLAGFAFLAYYALGLLPGFFAVPAGVGDIIAGATAPLAAFYISRITPRRKYIYAGWTVYGMSDLFNAMTLGTISTSSFTQIFHILPTSNPTIAELPMSLIPTFGVPLLMILEILALLKIRRSQATN